MGGYHPGEYRPPEVPLSRQWAAEGFHDPIWGPLERLMGGATPPTPRRPAPEVAVSVPVELTALEFLMLEVVKNVEEGKLAVAVTNLTHAVWKAHTTRDPIDDVRLRRLMGRVQAAGGGFDA